ARGLTMNKLACPLALLLLLAGGAAVASPRVGCYVMIDKVVLEPDANAPDRVQLWGVFAKVKDGGSGITEPVYGYMYFKAEPATAADARREWADLKKLEGTGQCVAFASDDAVGLKGRVRRAGETPAGPEPFPVVQGMFKLRDDNFPARELRALPIVTAPAAGSEVEPGSVTLTARNIVARDHPGAKYTFEIQTSSGT